MGTLETLEKFSPMKETPVLAALSSCTDNPTDSRRARARSWLACAASGSAPSTVRLSAYPTPFQRDRGQAILNRACRVAPLEAESASQCALTNAQVPGPSHWENACPWRHNF